MIHKCIFLCMFLLFPVYITVPHYIKCPDVLMLLYQVSISHCPPPVSRTRVDFVQGKQEPFGGSCFDSNIFINRFIGFHVYKIDILCNELGCHCHRSTTVVRWVSCLILFDDTRPLNPTPDPPRFPSLTNTRRTTTPTTHQFSTPPTCH